MKLSNKMQTIIGIAIIIVGIAIIVCIIIQSTTQL